MDLAKAAEEVAKLCGDRRGLRLLHVTDFHNKASAFRLARALAESVRPNLVVNTGDLSGVGGPIEAFLLRRWVPIPVPLVLAPGNHDGPTTMREVRRSGAVVLDRPRTVEVEGVRIFGYPDPNRTRLVVGPRYDTELCRRGAITVRPIMEAIGRPFIAAVHHEAMVGDPPSLCRLVLSGHMHSARIRRDGPTIWVRSATTGGRSRYGPGARFSVVDLQPDTLAVAGVRVFLVAGERVKMREA